MTVRTGLKHAVEGLLIGAGLAGVARTRVRRRTLVLAYHNVVSDDAPPLGDLSLHLHRSRFAAQLDELAKHAQIVPLDQVLAPHGTERPRVAITFDDAYRGAVTWGVEELARRGLPATIFVAPGLLAGHTFWWDALADPGSGLPGDVRSQGLQERRGEDAAIRAWAARAGHPAREVPDYARSASEDDLCGAVARGGVTLGSHSWSHPSLPRLSPAEIATELTRSRDWLADRFGATFIPWLSYPYGHFSSPVIEAAAAVGYRGALAIDGGWIPLRSPAPHSLPRLNVPAGLSPRGLALRAAGLFCR